MTRITKFLKGIWLQHGTKLLGWMTAVAGGWQTAILAQFFEAGRVEKRVVAGLVILLGSMTVKRGHTNTANSAPPPAPPSDKEPPSTG